MKRKIFILLTRFPDRGTRTIGRLTGNYYPHASIGLEEDMNTFYSIVTKGFIEEKLTRYDKPGRDPFPCQLYELEVSEKVYDKVKSIIEHFREFRELVRYSKMGLAMSLLRIPYKRNRFHFFCSHFVAQVLENSGAAKLRKKSHRCFSDDLKRLPGMRLNFQGNMRTMIKCFKLSPSLT